MRMRVINLISRFRSEQKTLQQQQAQTAAHQKASGDPPKQLTHAPEVSSILTSKQLLQRSVEQLHLHHHRVVIELRLNVAAAKIQHFFRALKVQRGYQGFLAKVRLIQRWVRKRFLQQNVLDVVERIRFAPIIQKYVRGYLSREKVAVAFHKFRMQRHLQEQEDLFSP